MGDRKGGKMRGEMSARAAKEKTKGEEEPTEGDEVIASSCTEVSLMSPRNYSEILFSLFREEVMPERETGNSLE